MSTIEQVQAVLARYQADLTARPYVSGVATTILNGEPAILVLLSRRPAAGEWLPSYLEGVRVITRVTGQIQAL